MKNNDDDIFDQMRKMMQNSFAGFFDDSIFEKELDKAIKIDPTKDKKSRSYSISYKYGTGMKEPEIHVEGDVDKDTVDRFLKEITQNPNSMGIGFQSIPALKANESKSDAVEPFTEVQETSDGVSIYMEMPGIGKNEVKTKWENETLTVSAEREDIQYEKSITVPFKAKKEIKIDANNGIITIEVQKK